MFYQFVAMYAFDLVLRYEIIQVSIRKAQGSRPAEGEPLGPDFEIRGRFDW